MASTVSIEQVELTRYVQSTFKIKSPQGVIWIDPFMVTSEHIGDDKADLILLTHEHGDHFSIDAINAVSKDGTKLACPNSGVENQIRGNASAELSVMKEGDTLDLSGVNVQAVAGYNTIHPRNDRSNSFNIGYIFAVGGQKLLHTGDTDVIPEFASFGELDIAMLPVGGNGYTMNVREAAQAISMMLKPKVFIPMHYGFAFDADVNSLNFLLGRSVQLEILDAVIPPMNMAWSGGRASQR